MFRICAALIASVVLPALAAAPAAFAADGKPLKPMAKPAFKAGATKVWRSAGQEMMEMVMEAGAQTISYARTDGCRFTRSHEEFAVFLTWEACGGVTGQQKVTLIDGKIWPLKIGRKFVYEIDGGNDRGRNWQLKMNCTVEEQARIEVPAGAFDTFHIVCDTDFRRRGYYMAPKLGTVVKLYRKNFRQSNRPDQTREMVSYAPGN
ncbi:MAG: hypothetical protein OXC10_20115 [Rhodospirillaceae bacterium]|nr:hypothetical protein [Rhodospirillaceae bacterium]